MKLQICSAVNNIIEDETGNNIATCWGSQKKKKALAKELVRCWNAFEEDGLVSDLLEACLKIQTARNEYRQTGKEFDCKELDKTLDAAIAKALPSQE